METLAYLHLAQVYEEATRNTNFDDECNTVRDFRFFQKLKLKKFCNQIFLQVLGVAFELTGLKMAHAAAPKSYVYPGSKGNEVSQIQKELQKRGYFNGNVTGYYGDKTKNAVIKFQRSQGLQADGIVGSATQGALSLVADKTPPSPQPQDETPSPQPQNETSPSAQDKTSPSPQLTKSLTSFTVPTKVKQQNLDLTYNVKIPPDFKKSQQLQTIVNEVVALAHAYKLPTDPLSITLIDAKTGEIASYQQNQPRFPASVIKLFWMVELYAQIEQGIWEENDFKDLIDKMINQSDNDAASVIVDAISNTQSGGDLSGKEYESWLKKRQWINDFFQAAGYKVNINQKVFPIDSLNIPEPEGRELQMRGNLAKPIYNQITTAQAARLLYEIYTGESVSPEASSKMLNWLTLDSAQRVARKNNKSDDYFNPVWGFLSQDLPDNVSFAGKAGGNSTSRHEVALIRSKDGEVTYILAIFAANRAYADNWEIFPEISQLVFKRMVARSAS